MAFDSRKYEEKKEKNKQEGYRYCCRTQNNNRAIRILVKLFKKSFLTNLQKSIPDEKHEPLLRFQEEKNLQEGFQEEISRKDIAIAARTQTTTNPNNNQGYKSISKTFLFFFFFFFFFDKLTKKYP